MPPAKKLYPVTVRKPPFSVQVPEEGERKPGHGIPRRLPTSVPNLPVSPDPSIKTLYDVVVYGANTHGDAECMGDRPLIKTHTDKKTLKKIVNGEEVEYEKQWVFYEMGKYKFISFNEYKKRVDVTGSGLRALGLNKGDLVHMYAATTGRWLQVSHATASQSMGVVTSYDTLGEAGLTHSLTQAESRAIFLDSHLLKKLHNPLKTADKIDYVIYTQENNEFNPQDVEDLKAAYPRLTIVSLPEVMKMGEENPVDVVLPDREDLCCIMYTSGSTGPPKGVTLKHKNVIAAVTGVTTVVSPHLNVGDYVLNFLPLAHILEFVFENAIMVWGGAMGYGHPRTLSDKAMRNCQGDIKELRPTVLVAVPAVWETIKKGIMDQISKLPTLKQKMFWGALSLKGYLLQNGLPGSALIDSIVFKKIKEATGGRMNLCMNGGGPVSKETHYFISMAIAPVIMGYGLTETTAMGCCMDPYAWDNESLGTLASSIEAKLVDFPEAGYFTTNTPEQGEIWIRGDSVADGYFRNDAETAEGFEDGWFKSGDIGQWEANGHLTIIDRKKNLVKTLAGEYIALEKLESVYRSCTAVQNILVYADANQNKPVAIIVPNEPIVMQIAKENGIAGEHIEQVVHDPKLTAIVLDLLLAQGKKGGLGGIELIQGVVMVEEEWTPQNGLVTSAQKLNRKGIVKAHQAEINKAYGLK